MSNMEVAKMFARRPATPAPSRSGLRGTTIIEYVLLAALLSLAAFVAINLTGQQLEVAYGSVSASVDGAL